MAKKKERGVTRRYQRGGEFEPFYANNSGPARPRDYEREALPSANEIERPRAEERAAFDVEVRFRGQVIPGVKAQFREIAESIPDENLPAIYMTTQEHRNVREPQIQNKIRSMFPDVGNQELHEVYDSNNIEEGFINYNTRGELRPRLRANNTPPISRVPYATNSRIESMVEPNREQNILEVPVRFRGQVIPDVMAEVKKSDGILGDIYYVVTNEHRRVREPEIYNKIHAMFPDTVNEQLVATIINIERGQQPDFLTYATMRELDEAAEENWRRTLQRWRFLHANIAPAANIYSNIPIVGERIVPENATNAITVEPFKVGNVMANFHGESEFGRYYSKNTFDKLRKKSITNAHKENPMTRQTIEPGNVTFYKKAATPEKTRKWWQFGKKKTGEEGSASQPKRKWWQFGKRTTRKENRKSRKTRKSRK